MHTALWTPYGEKTVEIPFAFTNEQEAPEAIFFTGFGEVDVGRIAGYLGRAGLRLAVTNLRIPTEGIHTDPGQYREAIAESIDAVRQAVLKLTGLSLDAQLGAAANSGGSAEAMLGLTKYPHRWKWGIFLSPFGAMFQYPDELRGGLLQEALRRPKLPKPLRRELSDKLGAGTNSFIESEGPFEYVYLSKLLPIAIVLAGKDALFPAGKTRASLPLPPDKVGVLDDAEHMTCYEDGIDNVIEAYTMALTMLGEDTSYIRVK